MFAKQSPGEIAKLGLYRILFSQVRVDEEGKIISDGFLTARLSEGKGTEYQLWDKLKACELLMKMEEMESGKREEGFSDILTALQRAAVTPEVEVLEGDGEEA